MFASLVAFNPLQPASATMSVRKRARAHGEPMGGREPAHASPWPPWGREPAFSVRASWFEQVCEEPIVVVCHDNEELAWQYLKTSRQAQAGRQAGR
jgi:hypothetical protein